MAESVFMGAGFPIKGYCVQKPLGGSKVNSDFHPSKVDQISTRNIWNSMVKSKLLTLSGSVALRQLNPIHKKRP